MTPADINACQCVRDYTGDPLVGCRPECLLSYDCPASLACINTRCLDPCPGTCGINAACTVENHNPVCRCHEGYHGDPFVQCSLDPGFITPPEPVDPCTPSPCGPNAKCHVDGYRPVCTCLPGEYMQKCILATTIIPQSNGYTFTYIRMFLKIVRIEGLMRILGLKGYHNFYSVHSTLL